MAVAVHSSLERAMTYIVYLGGIHVLVTRSFRSTPGHYHLLHGLFQLSTSLDSFFSCYPILYHLPTLDYFQPNVGFRPSFQKMCRST